jgi:bifunctional UDP-N-acetylglucosamine pyrophosphorylase / glucosamine-1-phosphate N-acetyltransferase
LENHATMRSLVMAAGKGSRMKGYGGNKALLPLVPQEDPFRGTRPILSQILEALPAGPKGLVVHHRKEDVIEATRGLGIDYFVQPELNGTGGALLAAREFVEGAREEWMVITMGDVPFVKKTTYLRLTEGLERNHLSVLGFTPEDRKQYGVLEVEDDRVRRITEWKYWRSYPEERKTGLRICNSGIYAFRIGQLRTYLDILSKRPHKVLKEREGAMTEIQEFFITDLVEWMDQDGLRVGTILAEDENEVMGIDDLDALRRAQEYFRLYKHPDIP